MERGGQSSAEGVAVARVGRRRTSGCCVDSVGGPAASQPVGAPGLGCGHLRATEGGGATVLGAVSKRQKALRAFAAQRHTLCAKDFLKFVAKLHAPTSGTVTVGPASSAG